MALSPTVARQHGPTRPTFLETKVRLQKLETAPRIFETPPLRENTLFVILSYKTAFHKPKIPEKNEENTDIAPLRHMHSPDLRGTIE
jgi:hypothetical protein